MKKCPECNGAGHMTHQFADGPRKLPCIACRGRGETPSLPPITDIVDRLYYGATCPVSGPGGDLAKDMLEASELIRKLRAEIKILESLT